MMSAKIEIRRVAVEKILDLRHRILRAGLPPESACFEGDAAETTLHFAAFAFEASGEASQRPIACLSLMLNSFQGKPAWQLRGMAVDEPQQGRGLGRELVTHAEQAVAADSPVRLLWCNARVPAAGFYQKHGWTIVSEVFEIPTAGPHVKMSKRLKDANPRETIEKPHSKR
ncbi:MAG TPA: GNAT family N-acetyltransferase [Verrucomicrobiae bacterium]|jgi:GNAT superfamily N-acetyltransferase|nr:GNAT family N-acetyltransferase [Verrucomicrobiae bacterium]